MRESLARKRSPLIRTDSDPHVSVREAARLLQCSRQAVLTRALAGELKTTMSAGRVVVSRQSVDRARQHEAATVG